MPSDCERHNRPVCVTGAYADMRPHAMPVQYVVCTLFAMAVRRRPCSKQSSLPSSHIGVIASNRTGHFVGGDEEGSDNK